MSMPVTMWTLVNYSCTSRLDLIVIVRLFCDLQLESAGQCNIDLLLEREQRRNASSTYLFLGVDAVWTER